VRIFDAPISVKLLSIEHQAHLPRPQRRLSIIAAGGQAADTGFNQTTTGMMLSGSTGLLNGQRICGASPIARQPFRARAPELLLEPQSLVNRALGFLPAWQLLDIRHPGLRLG